MGNFSKRIEALEGRGWASEPQKVEIVAGEPMTLEESRAVPAPTYHPGQAITRIELVPILPDAEQLPNATVGRDGGLNTS